MKLTHILAGSALASIALFTDLGSGLGLPHMTQAEAAVSVSFNVFYDRLGQHGDWVRYRDNYVFIPANVKRGWRPYTLGHWVYADRVGWTWASDESFGWATYHYGRWGYADDIGWYWVPGTRWAPAWVSWKKSSDYVVWAPLPPRGGTDVSVSVDVADVPDFYWVAVPTKRFLAPDLRVAIVTDTAERRRIVQRADVLGTVRVENNIVINNVIKVDVIERESGRKVKRVAIRETNDPAEARAGADQVTVFQGEVKADANAKPERVRDVKEARKIRREDAASGAAQSDTQQPEDATGTTSRQKSRQDNTGTSGATTGSDTSNGTAGGTGDASGTKKRERTKQTDQASPDNSGGSAPAAADDQSGSKKKRERTKSSDQTAPADTQDTSGTAAGEDQTAPATGKDKPAKRKKDKANNGADVTLPADNPDGNGADVTVPDQAQSGKAKADQNRKRAQDKQQQAAPDESGQAPANKTRNKAGQPDDQTGAGAPQQGKKKGKQQECDASDPACAGQ